MLKSKKLSKSIRLQRFRINHRSALPFNSVQYPQRLTGDSEMIPTGNVRSLGNMRRQPEIRPVQLSDEYEAVQKEATAVLTENVASFFSFEAIKKSGNFEERCYVVLLPQYYKEKPSTIHLSTMLAGIIERGPLHLLIIYGNVGKWSAGSHPKNPYRYETVENGASIGPAGCHWSGSFGGYLKEVNTGKVWGITCAHNLCAHDHTTPGLSDEELVELLADGYQILQPSESDKAYCLEQMQDVLTSYEERLSNLLEIEDPTEPPSYKVLTIKERIEETINDINILKNRDHTFGSKTCIFELGVDQGTLWDYVLIEITQRDRQGSNIMENVCLTPSSLDLSDPPEEWIKMVGRTSGPTGGTFKGYLGDGKVERIKAPFRCLYANGKGNMADLGDSGSWLRLRSMAVGYVFGGGTTEEMPLDTTWVADLNKVCARIRDKYGINLVVYSS